MQSEAVLWSEVVPIFKRFIQWAYRTCREKKVIKLTNDAAIYKHTPPTIGIIDLLLFMFINPSVGGGL